MNDRIPHTESDLVLAGVKAQPLRGGLRTALTPGSGRAPQAASGSRPTDRNNKIKSLRFQGIAS
jgi:hypothetical protein